MNSVNNFSLLRLVLNADIMVKIVLLLLLLASIFSWKIFFHKIMIFKKYFNYIKILQELLLTSTSVNDLYQQINMRPPNEINSFFIINLKKLFQNSGNSIQEICNEMRFQNYRISDLYIIGRGGEWLASIGSVAPFVGLFGTVWGIMNSFQTMSLAKNIHFLSFAPSIAEALLATAVGLLVAIPATVFYNFLSVKSRIFNSEMEDLIDNFLSFYQENLKR